MNQLTSVDYVILAVFLAISLAIAVYSACTGGKQRTNKEYLLGNQQMGMLPICISIFVSFQSAIAITGMPAEIYTYGISYWVAAFSIALGPLIAGLSFVPFFYRLRVVSVFEYLEMRFQHRSARLLGSGLSLIANLLYMAVCLYAPALSLSAVSATPVWASILIVGGIGTVYTAIGGIKAVVWTDVFQSGIMVAGIVAVAIQGTNDAGGWDQVWDIARRGERLTLPDFFSLDPTVRMTLWSSVIGMAFQWVNLYGLSQASVQRFCATKSLRSARTAVFINVPLMLVFSSITCYCGVVLFANYYGCDPILTDHIQNHNQLMPFFVVNSLGFLHGMPGLFITSLFSGALSTLSSGLNSMAANLWEDFLKKVPCIRQQSEKRQVLATKLIAVAFGSISVGLATLMQSIAGSVSQISFSFGSTAGGTTLGLFLLGMLVPFANWKGAIAGCVGGFGLTSWLVFGSMIHKVLPPFLPLSAAECSDVNATEMAVTGLMITSISQLNTTAAQPTPPSGLMSFYNISFLWFTLFGATSTLLIGSVVSCLTGGFDHRSVSSQLFFQPRTLWPCRLGKQCSWGSNVSPKAPRSEEGLEEGDEQFIKLDPIH